VLLYKNNSERDKSALDYINQGLNESQLCIYASVDAYDQLDLSRISPKIVNFKEKQKKFVNCQPKAIL